MVSGQLHDPAALIQERSLGIRWVRGRVGLGTDIDEIEKLKNVDLSVT
jgi:hypothetical protein